MGVLEASILCASTGASDLPLPGILEPANGLSSLRLGSAECTSRQLGIAEQQLGLHLVLDWGSTLVTLAGAGHDNF